MRQYPPSAWAIFSILIAALVHFGLGFAIEFSVDEAHYALYAQHLAFSYFDHPPLVGWIQWPLISLTSNEGIIRLVPELLWVLSCYGVFLVSKELHRLIQGRNAGYLTSALPSANTCALMSVLCIIAVPLPHVLAIGLLPDSILIPLSLGIMLMSIRWIRKDTYAASDWIVLGILLGLAGLSKYTACFTALALLIVFLLHPRKTWIRQGGFWLALLIALILISPVLYWNMTHDWISFRYQIAHGGGSSWAWRRVAAFLGLQVLCFGPLIIIGAFLFCKDCLYTSRRSMIALLSFFVIPFVIFAALSGGGGLPHWTSPAWFCLAPFSGIGLAKAWSIRHRFWIKFLLILQITLCLMGFVYVLSGGINTAAIKSNPIADLYGWKLAGQKAAELARANQVQGIAVQNWTLGSRIAWYAHPLPVFILDQRQDQFDLWFGELPLGSSVLLVNWTGMPFNQPTLDKPIDGPSGEKFAFGECKPIEHIAIERFGQNLSSFEFSLCSHWQKTGLRQ
ncbi:glycosyltransferase family 39 protein [Polynucleobacter paneuropaeus]|nr:glycosyltransferase family 39 protein [Polynucleobacter paneuropaeus]